MKKFDALAFKRVCSGIAMLAITYVYLKESGAIEDLSHKTRKLVKKIESKQKSDIN